MLALSAALCAFPDEIGKAWIGVEELHLRRSCDFCEIDAAVEFRQEFSDAREPWSQPGCGREGTRRCQHFGHRAVIRY